MSKKPKLRSERLESFSDYCFDNPEFANSYARLRLNAESDIPSSCESQLDSFGLLKENGSVKPVNETVSVGGQGYTITPSVVAAIGKVSDIQFLTEYYQKYGIKTYLDTIGYAVLYERGNIGDAKASVEIDAPEKQASLAVTYINGILVEYRDVDPHYNKIRKPDTTI